MLTYTVYSEAGGVGKTTLAGNLAKAEQRAGKDVLLIDLDPQDGSLSHLLDVDDDRDAEGIDTLLAHLVGQPRGDFDGLVRESEGIDVVPAHNSLANASRLLERQQEQSEELGSTFNPNVQLARVLREAGVSDRYDTLIVDPPANADEKLYNAIHATRNLVIPFEPSGKGEQSVNGLEAVIEGLEHNLDVSVGVHAVVPNRVKGTNDQEAAIEEIRERYAAPITLRERSSLFGGCWREQCTSFTYVDEHRDRERDYELATLEKIDRLAAAIREDGA